MEGTITDARYTGGDCYARKTGATPEYPIADTCHTVRDSNGHKFTATREGRISDARHAVTYCCTRQTGATIEG